MHIHLCKWGDELCCSIFSYSKRNPGNLGIWMNPPPLHIINSTSPHHCPLSATVITKPPETNAPSVQGKQKRQPCYQNHTLGVPSCLWNWRGPPGPQHARSYLTIFGPVQDFFSTANSALLVKLTAPVNPHTRPHGSRSRSVGRNIQLESRGRFTSTATPSWDITYSQTAAGWSEREA